MVLRKYILDTSYGFAEKEHYETIQNDLQAGLPIVAGFLQWIYLDEVVDTWHKTVTANDMTDGVTLNTLRCTKYQLWFRGWLTAWFTLSKIV